MSPFDKAILIVVAAAYILFLAVLFDERKKK